MKTKFLIVFLLFVSMIVSAQDVTFLRAKSVSVREYDYQDWGPWKDANVLISIDFDRQIITIDNQYDDRFYISAVGDKERYRDKDGDYYDTFSMSAIDNEGQRCTLIYARWVDYDITTITIRYSDLQYTYHCNLIE